MASGKAGKNEKIFREYFESKYGTNSLSGKVPFSSEDKTLKVSADMHLKIGGKTVLFEIDSYNMAKVVSGQYTIMNSLIDANQRSNMLFIIIHFYKDYNSARTRKYLKHISEVVFQNKSIAYRVFTFSEFKKYSKNYSKISELIESLVTSNS